MLRYPIKVINNYVRFWLYKLKLAKSKVNYDQMQLINYVTAVDEACLIISLRVNRKRVFCTRSYMYGLTLKIKELVLLHKESRSEWA